MRFTGREIQKQRSRVYYLNIGTFSTTTIGRPTIYRISTNDMDGCCVYVEMKQRHKEYELEYSTLRISAGIIKATTSHKSTVSHFEFIKRDTSIAKLQTQHFVLCSHSTPNWLPLN